MPSEVTILLLVCNRDNFLAQALASVRAQTHTNWQLIVSDASTDVACRTRIGDIFADHLASEHPPESRSQLIQHRRPLLQGDHLAAVWPLVTTDFLALLDDDDAWLPQHLSRALDWLSASEQHGLAMSNSLIIDEHGELTGASSNSLAASPVPYTSPSAWLRYLLSSPFSSTSGYVFRTDAVRGHHFINTSCVDVHLAVTALLENFRAQAFPEPGFLYRRHGGSAYAKGEHVFSDRHRFRVYLAKHHLLAITAKVSAFPLLVLKSLMALAKRTHRRSET